MDNAELDLVGAWNRRPLYHESGRDRRLRKAERSLTVRDAL